MYFFNVCSKLNRVCNAHRKRRFLFWSSVRLLFNFDMLQPNWLSLSKALYIILEGTQDITFSHNSKSNNPVSKCSHHHVFCYDMSIASSTVISPESAILCSILMETIPFLYWHMYIIVKHKSLLIISSINATRFSA